MERMTQVLWVDKKNMIACVQAGIRGVELERQMNKFGVICGHEPDSMEFSTLGGWISTRASGMKKNTYGNIEDIVQNFNLVTPAGSYSMMQPVPRMSAGPNFNQVLIGNEGNFGIITDAIIKVKPKPEVQIFNAIVFESFETGILFMHEMSKQRIWPTSLRMVDNDQYRFSRALKGEKTLWDEFMESVAQFYLQKVKGFNPLKLAAATCMFEGEKTLCEEQERAMIKIAKKHGAVIAGAEHG